MLGKLTALLLALLLPTAALAEAYEGTTAAMTAVTVYAQSAGTVGATSAQVGQRVTAGDELARLEPERGFAAGDGTVSLVNAEAGDDVDGTLMELMPAALYQIYCTVDKAYQSAESTLVHSGETVYARCTKDGTHRSVGVITLIDGEEYRVLTIGGELYVGETVYLYRDADFTAAGKVGIGTVVSNDTQAYEASGTLTRLCVQPGDTVERGQLLYELGGGSVEAPVSGILTSVSAQAGDAVAVDQAMFEIVPDGMVCVTVSVDEADAAGISPGDRATLIPAGQDEDDALGGTVIDVAHIAEDGKYTVRILPDDDTSLPIGMSVTARM